MLPLLIKWFVCIVYSLNLLTSVKSFSLLNIFIDLLLMYTFHAFKCEVDDASCSCSSFLIYDIIFYVARNSTAVVSYVISAKAWRMGRMDNRMLSFDVHIV